MLLQAAGLRALLNSSSRLRPENRSVLAAISAPRTLLNGARRPLCFPRGSRLRLRRLVDSWSTSISVEQQQQQHCLVGGKQNNKPICSFWLDDWLAGLLLSRCNFRASASVSFFYPSFEVAEQANGQQYTGCLMVWKFHFHCDEICCAPRKKDSITSTPVACLDADDDDDQSTSLVTAQLSCAALVIVALDCSFQQQRRIRRRRRQRRWQNSGVSSS